MTFISVQVRVLSEVCERKGEKKLIIKRRRSGLFPWFLLSFGTRLIQVDGRGLRTILLTSPLTDGRLNLEIS